MRGCQTEIAGSPPDYSGQEPVPHWNGTREIKDLGLDTLYIASKVLHH